MANSIHQSDRCILVEGPHWGDAKFYGAWLLAAAEAEAFWKEAFKDSDFSKQVESVSLIYIPDFGIAASVMLMLLKEHLTTFVVGLDSEEAQELAMMVAMGFFTPINRRYQMTVPSRLTAAKVREAILKYAQTESDDSGLHPEYLVTTMSFAEAREWQNRLRAIDEFQRNDNHLLLPRA